MTALRTYEKFSDTVQMTIQFSTKLKQTKPDTEHFICIKYNEAHGSIVVKALCYKPEGRGFETRRGEFFSIYLILPVAPRPGAYLNRSEYQKHKNVSWGVELGL
jgi:hypothetical protein